MAKVSGEVMGPPTSAPCCDSTTIHGLAAFRGCDAHDRIHGIAYEAVTEAHGPTAVAAMVAAGERAGMLCPAAGRHLAPGFRGANDGTDCAAVLDLVNAAGEPVADRCIPTREAFEWWRRTVELRAVSSDCAVEEAEAYAWTYGALAGPC